MVELDRYYQKCELRSEIFERISDRNAMDSHFSRVDLGALTLMSNDWLHDAFSKFSVVLNVNMTAQKAEATTFEFRVES